jgi:predicted membrane protein
MFVQISSFFMLLRTVTALLLYCAFAVLLHKLLVRVELHHVTHHQAHHEVQHKKVQKQEKRSAFWKPFRYLEIPFEII